MTFPSSIEASEYFGVPYNNLSTKSTQEASATDTTIYVSSTANFPSSGWFAIDDEIVEYTGKTSGSFTGCTRGADNTTAAVHLSGATVSLTFPAIMWTRAIAEVRAALTKIGIDSSTDTSSIDYLVKNTNPNAVKFTNGILLAETSTPSTPASGYGQIYFKSDGKPYYINDNGTEKALGGGGMTLKVVSTSNVSLVPNTVTTCTFSNGYQYGKILAIKYAKTDSSSDTGLHQLRFYGDTSCTKEISPNFAPDLSTADVNSKYVAYLPLGEGVGYSADTSTLTALVKSANTATVNIEVLLEEGST